jgi:hypothetical protein
MINQLMQALNRFRIEETNKAAFERIFGVDDADRLLKVYKGYCGRNLLEWYAYLNPNERTLFEAHLSANLPALYIEPRCAECGGELTESDIEAGEDVCLDCAAGLALASDIEHEPRSLLATVKVRLEEEYLYEADARAGSEQDSSNHLTDYQKWLHSRGEPY